MPDARTAPTARGSEAVRRARGGVGASPRRRVYDEGQGRRRLRQTAGRSAGRRRRRTAVVFDDDSRRPHRQVLKCQQGGHWAAECPPVAPSSCVASGGAYCRHASKYRRLSPPRRPAADAVGSVGASGQPLAARREQPSSRRHSATSARRPEGASPRVSGHNTRRLFGPLTDGHTPGASWALLRRPRPAPPPRAGAGAEGVTRPRRAAPVDGPATPSAARPAARRRRAP